MGVSETIKIAREMERKTCFRPAVSTVQGPLLAIGPLSQKDAGIYQVISILITAFRYWYLPGSIHIDNCRQILVYTIPSPLPL